METTDYNKQAADFIEKTGLQITKEYMGHRPYFEGDKEQRAVWQITFKRGSQSYTFTFGQSIHDSYTCRNVTYWQPQRASVPMSNVYNVRGYKEAVERGGGEFQKYRLEKAQIPPTDYDILACIEKYDPGTFEDFCANLGYDIDSRKAAKTYFDVQKQAAAIRRMFNGEELEALQEIQ